MDLQPHLTGKIVSLRPLASEDFEKLYSCAADPLVWELHPSHDRYKREVFEKFFEGALNSKGALVAIDGMSKSIIGSSRFYNHKDREITIGYTFLSRTFWGGIYNFEMKKLMLDHAFQSVDRVFFEIGRDNIRSRKAIEKIGAKLHHETNLDSNPYCIYVIEGGFNPPRR